MLEHIFKKPRVVSPHELTQTHSLYLVEGERGSMCGTWQMWTRDDA